MRPRSPWRPAPIWGLPLSVGLTPAPVSHPDQSRPQQWLIRVHLLNRPGERKECGGHGWGVPGMPAAAEARRKLLQSEAGRVLSRADWLQVWGPGKAKLHRLPGSRAS